MVNGAIHMSSTTNQRTIALNQMWKIKYDNSVRQSRMELPVGRCRWMWSYGLTWYTYSNAQYLFGEMDCNATIVAPIWWVLFCANGKSWWLFVRITWLKHFSSTSGILAMLEMAISHDTINGQCIVVEQWALIHFAQEQNEKHLRSLPVISILCAWAFEINCLPYGNYSAYIVFNWNWCTTVKILRI